MLGGPEYCRALVNIAGRHSIFAGALLKALKFLLCGIQRLLFGVNFILLLAAVFAVFGLVTELCADIAIIIGRAEAHFPVKHVQFALQQSDFLFLCIDLCLPLFGFCLCCIGRTLGRFFGVSGLVFALFGLPCLCLCLCRCRIGGFGRLSSCGGRRQIVVVDHPNRGTRFFGRAILACKIAQRLRLGRLGLWLRWLLLLRPSCKTAQHENESYFFHTDMTRIPVLNITPPRKSILPYLPPGNDKVNPLPALDFPQASAPVTAVAAGKVTVNVVPWAPLSTVMLPPCSVMIRCTSARPRPVPFVLVVKNGMNILGKASAGIP